MKFLLGLIAALAAAPVHAEYYAGKTITIVVGYKTGGGYDATARLLARHLPKHIPGKPDVIVQNMPGAGSIIAANHVYAVAKPDGLSIGTFNRSLPIAQLTRIAGVRYDMTKFAWIGSAASEGTILAIRSDLPFNTFAELRQSKQQIVIGATAPGANTYDFPLLLKEYLGANLKIVTGYQSSADIMLAIERKEVDGRAGSFTSMRPFIDRKLVKPVVRSRGSESGVEGLPIDEDLAPTLRARAVMALRSAPEIVGRPYVMHPNTSPEHLKIMRVAFASALKDKVLVAEAGRARMDLEFVNGDVAMEVMKQMLSQPQDLIDEFSKYVKFGE